jgi:thiamine pyrophosphokinase
MKGCIVSGGFVEDEFTLSYLKKEDYDVVFAVDRGLSFFYRTGAEPDYIVGDFDSVEKSVLEQYQNRGSRIELLNPVKDDTDTEHALHMAIDMGCREIHLFGVTGTRVDHMLGNLQLLGLCLKAGVEGVMLDPWNRIRLLNEGTSLERKNQFGKFVSLIPYTPQVTGLTLRGFKYPLESYTMSCYYVEGVAPISGVSNEVVEERADIDFDTGILVLVEARD